MKNPTQHTQHTAGPWTVDGNHFQIWAGDGEKAVASIYATTAPEPMASEARANARLIAAAPELLAALDNANNTLRSLEALLSTIDADGRTSARDENRSANVHTYSIRMTKQAQETARAALARAKGNP